MAKVNILLKQDHKENKTAPKKAKAKVTASRSVKKTGEGRKFRSMYPHMNDRFRLTRKEMELTQTQFASLLSTPSIEVTLSTIKQIENKNVTPNHFLIMRLKHKCGKSYQWIFEGKD